MNQSVPPITVGVVGLGRAGWGIHVRDLRNDPRYRIVAVADPSEERCAEARGSLGCESYRDLSALLAGSAADLIVLATPNLEHEAGALACLGDNRHCVLEKPMALTYRSGLSIQDEAKRSGKILAVNHVHLFRDEYHFLDETIRSGVLGEVFELRFEWSKYKRRNDWQTSLQNGGGHLGNYGSHALSMMFPLLGSTLESLHAVTRHIKDAGDADDHATVSFEMTNGKSGRLIVTTCCELSGPRFAVYGTCGALQYAGEGKALLRSCDPEALVPLTVIEGAAPNRQYGTGEILPWKEERREIKPARIYGTFYDNVYAAIREEAALISGVPEALSVVRAIEWAYTGADPMACVRQREMEGVR